MTTAISKTYEHREWQTIVLLGLVVLSVVSYIFLVNRVIFHAVGKQTASHGIATLANEVTGLETQALTLANNVTLDLAYERGFLDSGARASYTVAWRGYGHE